jgi:uncharacterized damage-inducible protein DinB
VNPIGGILRHIGGSSQRLLLYALGEPVPEELRRRFEWEFDPTGDPPAQVLAAFHEEVGRVQERLLRLRPEDLSAVRTFPRRDVDVEAMFILHHLVEHAQHHAGQVIALRKLWDAGVARR